MEQWYLDNFYDELYNINKNASDGGDLISYHPQKSKIVSKMKRALKNRYLNMSKDDRKVKYGKPKEQNPMFGKSHNEDVRSKISGKVSAYYKNNPSPNKGKSLSEERRRQISKIASQRIGRKNSFFGKTHTEKTKEKLRQAKVGNKPANSKPVIIDGIEFESVTEASRKLGVVPATIIHRIKSKNPKYANYFYKQ